jgi:hypothetical protein
VFALAYVLVFVSVIHLRWVSVSEFSSAYAWEFSSVSVSLYLPLSLGFS